MNLAVKFVKDWREFRAGIEHAIRECERRNPGEHTAEDVLACLEQQIVDGRVIAMVVADLDSGKSEVESVVGFLALGWWEDSFNDKFAMITSSWAAPGMNGATFDLLDPLVQRLAHDMGCKYVGCFGQRQLRAYEKWISQWGYEPFAVLYTKKVKPPTGGQRGTGVAVEVSHEN